jgi:hypothetical protein
MLTWKITDMQAVDGVIKAVKYHVQLADGGNSVETEGYCYLSGNGGTPVAELTEEQVIGWVKEVCPEIENVLRMQLNNVQPEEVALPWRPATFKLSV